MSLTGWLVAGATLWAIATIHERYSWWSKRGEQARETLDAMQDNSRSRQAMEMDMRYEQTVQRAMSVCRLSRGNDSDDGNWSDNGLLPRSS